VIFYENNGNAAHDMLQSSAGEYHFCRFCELDGSCDHSGGKLTPRTLYVLRYIYEFEAGVTAYPLSGSWEYQPLWFYEMFMAGRSELNRCRNEAQRREIDAAKRKR